ncbi:MAG: hypothetical protein DDT40_01836 [candidate division WS2 bacterium]|nr:hypothetical protein [Candidatus Psychracetigena formicireducens]
MLFYIIILEMQRGFKSRFILSLSVILGALLIIAIVIVYIGFDISTKAGFISDAQTQLLKRETDIANLTNLKEQEKAADAALFKLNNVLPKKDALFSVSRDLGDFARARNLSFGSKFGEEIASKDNKPGFIRLEMNTGGSYADLVAFIKDIEASGYFINLLNFDIVRQGASFSALLDGEVFFSD